MANPNGFTGHYLKMYYNSPVLDDVYAYFKIWDVYLWKYLETSDMIIHISVYDYTIPIFAWIHLILVYINQYNVINHFIISSKISSNLYLKPNSIDFLETNLYLYQNNFNILN